MTRLNVKSAPDRKIVISIEEGGSVNHLEVNSDNGATIAAYILQACADSYIKSGAPVQDLTKQRPQLAVAPMTALGIGPSRIPNHESLLLQFGDTVLSVPIEITKLRYLGEALITLSAKTDHPQ